ncbi:secondary thiamine-phosphate synthase enzyme YjbQ [Chloroflexota bacterium]
MAIHTATLSFETQGSTQMIDITPEVARVVRDSELDAGIVTVFCPGSTGGITTIEYEGGAISDFQRLFGEIAPENKHYAHNARWGDGNGHSHISAALLGPSLTVPFADRALLTGTWQQIIFVDFDNRGRSRRVVVQVMGEKDS